MGVDFDGLLNRSLIRGFGEQAVIHTGDGFPFRVKGDFHRGEHDADAGLEFGATGHETTFHFRTQDLPPGCCVEQENVLMLRDKEWRAVEVTEDDSGWVTVHLDIDL